MGETSVRNDLYLILDCFPSGYDCGVVDEMETQSDGTSLDFDLGSSDDFLLGDFN